MGWGEAGYRPVQTDSPSPQRFASPTAHAYSRSLTRPPQRSNAGRSKLLGAWPFVGDAAHCLLCKTHSKGARYSTQNLDNLHRAQEQTVYLTARERRPIAMSLLSRLNSMITANLGKARRDDLPQLGSFQLQAQ